MADLEPAWEFRTDDNVWAACLSSDGQLIVLGSWDNNAYALDRKGEVLWKHKTSDYVKGIGISSDADLTVVGSYDRYIYAIKPSGKLAWRYKTENYVRAVAVSSDGEYVTAGSWRGTVYYLDKRGKLLWKQRLSSAIIDLAISDDGGLVVAGCEDGSVHAFDAGGGERWSHVCGGTVTDVTVSQGGERTVVAAKDTLLSCFDDKGTIVWTFHLGGSSKGLRFIQGDEIVVAFTDNNFLQYVDSKGDLMFMRRFPEEIWEGSVADDGISVAVATKDNRTQFFENSDLASVVLEVTQQTLEKAITDNIDISKAQEMHRHAGELLSDHEYGEAIRLALEAQVQARKTHKSHLADRASTIVEEVDGLIADNSSLDMRKAQRYLGKARRGLAEGKLERTIFYGEQAKAAVEASIDKGAPAVEDELFHASLSGPLDTDEKAVDRMLGKGAPDEATLEEVEPEAPGGEPGLADEVADEIGETVAEMGATEEGDQDEGLETPPEPSEGGGAEAPPEEEPSPEGDQGETICEEYLEALGEPPEESPAELYIEQTGGEAPEEDTGPGTIQEELQDVCPQCGEPAGKTEDGECVSCVSDEMMKFAVDRAKSAHKDGMDISSLAPDLKAVKAARQEKDFEEVISISERILDELDEILGEDSQGDSEDHKVIKRRKKKKRK